MAGNLTGQVRNIAAVTTAVANGDLSKKITVDVRGEILELKNTINTMVDQLNSFASEVTRVAREVGTEGKLGGQAEVRGVSGTWKDLTDNVNSMAGNLTNQVRGMAKVVTAVANGDLKRKLLVEAKGEIAALADTINNMIDTLATFADQVTTVAREVGTEGKLGGQSNVPGAAGTWLELNNNVNQLAATLTTQLRAISDVATAVTEGDLTRSVTVEARGEVAQLKDTINEMIRNLRDTTLKNSEQDWLKTNLANFTRMLQGQRDLMAVGKMVLSELAPVVSAQQGVFYIVENPTAADGGKAPLPARRRDAHQAARLLRLPRAEARDERIPARRRAGRPGGARKGAHPVDRRAWRLRHPHRLRAGRGAADEHHRPACRFRKPGQGGHRAVEFPAFQPDAPGVPGPAHGKRRHRAQHDRGEQPDRRSAQAIAVAHQRTPEPPAAVAEQQSGTGAKGAAIGRSKRRGRAQEQRGRKQEPGGRAGPARAGRKSQATGADLQVQERIPGQYEPRVAHAAQQPAHSRGPTREQSGRQSHRAPGRIFQDDPRQRQGPAAPHQRHSGSLQDRERHRHAGFAQCAAARGARDDGAHFPSRRPEQGRGFRDRPGARIAERASRPTASGWIRC